MEWLENVNLIFHDNELRKKLKEAKYSPIMKKMKTDKMTEEEKRQIDLDNKQYDAHFEELARTKGIETMNMFYKHIFEVSNGSYEIQE